MRFDRVLSYCECSGEDPVYFLKVEESENEVVGRCEKCGRIEKFPAGVWYGPEEPEEAEIAAELVREFDDLCRAVDKAYAAGLLSPDDYDTVVGKLLELREILKKWTNV